MRFAIGIRSTNKPDTARRRLIAAWLFSVLLHAVVLSLQFGLPGLGLPWNNRLKFYS